MNPFSVPPTTVPPTTVPETTTTVAAVWYDAAPVAFGFGVIVFLLVLLVLGVLVRR